MNRDRDRELLAEIRAMTGTLPAEFTLGADAGQHLCLFAPSADGDGHETIAHILPAMPYQAQRALQHAPTHYRFLLRLLDQAFETIRALRKRLEHHEPPPRPEPRRKDHAAEAAMKCQTPAFRRYLTECHDLPANADTERTAIRLRTLLQVKSRSELNTDPAALARWKNLKGDFETWMRS